ncbi:hypothetical protein MJO28_004182 [Puccinia striiformis f. sp. tritici]|uniref:Uncharacterized protein n=2 Tax=Puccinia striiformis TaxID=27350 RepID=A0A2S4W4T1_9BASI|nr:hypothetical protein MJO28_004182 [Puccinia striiformis f. sp. tritici]POW16780.1 hypothetical protein PSHT_06711 [Puccinia striiformis]
MRDTVTIAGGAVITSCEPHHLELCYDCGMDFVSFDNDARSDSIRLKCSPEPGSKNPNSTPLDGRLVAIAKEKDPESFYYGEDCYVIELEDDTMISEHVDSLHVESKWLVKVDGQYIDAPKARQLFFS